MLEALGKAPEALDQIAQGIDCWRAAYGRNPRRRDWLTGLRAAHLRRADTYLKLGNSAEYEAELAGVKWMAEYLDSASLRLSRIDDRLDHGDRAAALKEADDLFTNCDLSAANLDDLAAFYARAATAGSSEPETSAARAVETLRRTCELGRMSFMSLDADPRYRVLTGRADFKKLVAEQRK